MGVLMKRFLATVILLSGCTYKGRTGDRGPAGVSGIDGESCTVEQEANGSVIMCPDGTSAVVLNGQDGLDGQDASQSAYSVVDIIRPCPGPGYREVLLRLENGNLLAHYSDGQKEFLSFLTPGNYQLTDGSNCSFTVHSDLSVTW